MNRALVTGGGGFVGKVIVRMLAERGIPCRVVGRHRYPEVEALGAESIACDIRDRDRLRPTFAGIDTVFHTASLAGIWGKREEYHSINVQGTENVLQACRDNGVARLIYTSTPSVVFDRRDIVGVMIDEPTRQRESYGGCRRAGVQRGGAADAAPHGRTRPTMDVKPQIVADVEEPL